MAEAVQVRHAFVLSKTDSPDPTIVSSSEWNAAELFTGGGHGQILTRDGTSLTGASYINKPVMTGFVGSHAGVSPSPPLCVTNVIIEGLSYALVTTTVNAVTSGGAAVSIGVYVNDILHQTIQAPGSGFSASGTFVLLLNPSGYTYKAIATAVSGTFTSLTITLATFAIGTL